MVEQNGFKERGTLKITDITSSEIELTLTTREGAFWEWAKVTKLTALEFPSGYGNNTDWKQRIKDSADKVCPAEYFTIYSHILIL